LDKLIPYALNGLEVLLTNLFTQFTNMNIYGSTAYNHFLTPNFIENYLPLKHLIGLRGQ
jgi:hypothetical protein